MLKRLGARVGQTADSTSLVVIECICQLPISVHSFVSVQLDRAFRLGRVASLQLEIEDGAFMSLYKPKFEPRGQDTSPPCLT